MTSKRTPCDCKIAGTYLIDYCPLHEAAGALLEALQALTNYDWHQCHERECRLDEQTMLEAGLVAVAQALGAVKA